MFNPRTSNTLLAATLSPKAEETGHKHFRRPRTLVDLQRSTRIRGRRSFVGVRLLWAATQMFGDNKAPKGFVDADVSWTPDASNRVHPGHVDTQATWAPDVGGLLTNPKGSSTQRLRGPTCVGRIPDARGSKRRPKESSKPRLRGPRTQAFANTQALWSPDVDPKSATSIPGR